MVLLAQNFFIQPTFNGDLSNFWLGPLQKYGKKKVMYIWVVGFCEHFAGYINLGVDSPGPNIGPYLVLQKLPDIFPNIILQMYKFSSHSRQQQVACIIFSVAAERPCRYTVVSHCPCMCFVLRYLNEI